MALALALGDILESGWLKRAGIAASIAVHLLFLGWLIFGARVQPFAFRPPQSITVELVPSQDAPATKEDDKPKPDFSLPDIKPDETKASMPEASSEPAAKPSATAPADSSPESASTAAEGASPVAPGEPPAPQAGQAAAIDPPGSPAVPPVAATFGAPVTSADISEQYGTFFQAAGPGYEGPSETAKLKSDVIGAFRAHLKSCSVLPAGIPLDDKVRVVLRVALNRDGTLAAPPALIQAKVSPNGPALRQAAVQALQGCQPYSMLPADRYEEWKLLDLDFTPGDFRPG